MKKPELRLLGGMSGTSTDGVDISALTFSESQGFVFNGVHSESMPDNLRCLLLRLQETTSDYSGEDPLRLLAVARRDLSELYARAATTLLHKLNWSSNEVDAFGVHGQTIRHEPSSGFTLQVIDPALVASMAGVPVVSDFRSADVAAGGQGAPLVPPFHRGWLASRGLLSSTGYTLVLNLGGFSNLTVIDAVGNLVQGGDCGPASCYLDAMAQRFFDSPFDDRGEFAQSGQIVPELLARLMAHPYFQKIWPASTGRDDFNLGWLDAVLADGFSDVSPYDVMATLTQMSVLAVCRCIGGLKEGGTVYICGGGIQNKSLVHGLQQQLGTAWKILLFDDSGLPAQAVESAAFAWLAARHLQGLPGNSPIVTGAKRDLILGQFTPLKI